MGSYECTTAVDEPMCGSTAVDFSENLVSEHQPCPSSSSVYCLLEYNSNEFDNCPLLSGDDILLSNAKEPTGDWLVTQCENPDESTLSNELYSKCGISGVSFDENRVEADACNMNSERLIQCNKYRLSNTTDGFKLTSEIIAKDSSSGFLIQQNEVNANNSLGGSPETMVKEVMDEKKIDLIERDADTGGLLSPSLGSGLSFNSMDPLTSYCFQKNVLKDTDSINGFVVPDELEPFNKFASTLRDHIEPLLPKACDSVMHSVVDSGRMDNKYVIGFSTEKNIEVAELGNRFDDPCITIISSMGCQKTDEIVEHVGSLTPTTRESVCLEKKSCISPLEQSSLEVSKDCNYITLNTKVDVAKNTMPVERNSNVKEGSMTGNSIAEKSAPQELCHPFDVRDDGSSVMIDTQNISLGDVTFLSSTRVFDSSGQIDNGSRDNFRVDCVPEVNCDDAVASTSGLNVQRSKSLQKTRKKKHAKRSKSARKAPQSCRNVQIIFEAARRKRTCLSKPSRSTIWGSLSCMTQSSLVISDVHNQQFQNQELMKGRKGKHKSKQKKNERNRRSKGSKQEKCSTSTGFVRLKVKLGKHMDQSFLNIVIPDVDTSLSGTATNGSANESCWKTSFDLPKLTKHNECEILEEANGKHVNSKENPDNLCCTLSRIQPESNVSIDSIIKLKKSLDQADDSIGISSMIVDSVDGVSYTQPYDSGANDPSCSSMSKLSIEPFSLSKATVFVQDDLKIESIIAAKALSDNDYQCKLFGPTNLKDPLPSSSKSLEHSESSKFRKASKGRSKISDSAKRSGNAPRQRDNQGTSVGKNKLKKVCDYAGSTGVSYPESGNLAAREVSNLNIVNDVSNEKYSHEQNAWVLCDDCQKWRRIPAGLVDTIGQESCTWTCKDNTDKSFADCAIPQEKSNLEINAELEISEASADDEASRAHRTYRLSENQRSKVLQERGYTRIKSNHYLHRTRKSQTIDEIMICHCKAPSNGKVGCGDECLNRMLNIECNRGTCPCGDLCSNLQFQKRNYAKLGRFKCGKKGFGLELLEDISQGQFLIEYVGEVLDMPAYEARQKEYAIHGHRHFYFMTLNCNEVIDASAKGNLGRFINHSCEPNCRTEKWMVNGEICIGLFALRDIKKGEEVTFDYNYVRVFGAAAKKCYCGSTHCRGSIGGDPLNSGVIIQSDSDEDYLEPVVLLEDGKANDGLSTQASSFDCSETLTVESLSNSKEEVDKFRSSVEDLDITKEEDEPINDSDFTVPQLQSSPVSEKLMVSVPSASQVLESSQQTDIISKTTSTAHPDIMVHSPSHKSSCIADDTEPSCLNSMNNKSLSDGFDCNKKIDAVEPKRVSSKRRPLVKTSRKSAFVKKGNVTNDPILTNKVPALVNKLLSVKPKKIMEASLSGRFEAVEEKLNELLDTNGGISKRKDAAKGYLKLLLLTAASGDRVSGEAIQSNRDLSMILDALLKTKSRVVLTDIINKNGLQMLHNMMKQYRCDFKKIPILRKLLKVLEYLAVREIVCSEHINAGPRCLGMESFAESMLSLTEHDDKQVHQIARKFRDRWIHRPLRKFVNKEKDDGRIELHRGPTETIDGVKQLVVADAAIHTNVGQSCSISLTNDPIGTPKPRKRKSRWDQPTASIAESIAHQSLEQNLEPSLSNGVGEVIIDKVNSSVESNSLVHNFCQQHKFSKSDDGDLNNTDDVPPGFSSPLYSIESSNASSAAFDLPPSNNGLSKCFSTVAGQLQEKFISRLPVSYGVPLSIVQQFGTSQAENLENWIIAPAIPFHPFPPLPPFKQEKKVTPPHAPVKQSPEKKQWDNYGPHTSYEGESSHGSVVSNQPFLDGPPGSNQHPFKRARRPACDLGKRHFKQEKWDNACDGPPWLQRRDDWGYLENIQEGQCRPQT